MVKKWRDFATELLKESGIEGPERPEDLLAMMMYGEEMKRGVKLLRGEDVVIYPGEAAVLLRGGKIEDVLTQRREAARAGMSLLSWLRGKIFGTEDESLLFVDTTPVDLRTEIDEATRDHYRITGTCTSRVQLMHENAPKVINLLGRSRFLTRAGLGERLMPELRAKVFQPFFSQYGGEILEKGELRERMRTSAEVELRKTQDLFGINLLDVFIVWDKAIRYCPRDEKVIPEGARYCPYCGLELKAP